MRRARIGSGLDGGEHRQLAPGDALPAEAFAQGGERPRAGIRQIAHRRGHEAASADEPDAAVGGGPYDHRCIEKLLCSVAQEIGVHAGAVAYDGEPAGRESHCGNGGAHARAQRTGSLGPQIGRGSEPLKHLGAGGERTEPDGGREAGLERSRENAGDQHPIEPRRLERTDGAREARLHHAGLGRFEQDEQCGHTRAVTITTTPPP